MSLPPSHIKAPSEALRGEAKISPLFDSLKISKIPEQPIKVGKGSTTGTKIEWELGDGALLAGSTMTAALKVVCWSAPSKQQQAAQAARGCARSTSTLTLPP